MYVPLEMMVEIGRACDCREVVLFAYKSQFEQLFPGGSLLRWGCTQSGNQVSDYNFLIERDGLKLPFATSNQN